jgi:hypothetical protein
VRYAANTKVSSDKSRQEIEAILVRYGASGFIRWADDSAVIAFRYNEKNIKFVLPLPDRNSKKFTHTESRGRLRHPDDQRKVYEQAVKQRWRALALSIKAKLEAVESGIATFEEEFLPYIVIHDGMTVAQWLLPQLNDFYLSGKGPKMLMSSDGGVIPMCINPAKLSL